jgi:hypothetical protein
MEKKGDLLNQLAIIADLIEKMNVNSANKSLLIKVDDKDFNNLFEYFQNKNDSKLSKPTDIFVINMESVEIIFSKNSV